MAWVWRLEQNRDTQDLHSVSSYDVLDYAAPAPPVRQAWSTGTIESTGRHLVHETHDAREVTLTLRVRAGNANELATRLSVLEQWMRRARDYEERGVGGAPVYLSVRFDGATNSTRFRVLTGSIDGLAPLSRNIGVRFWQEVFMVLTCAPYAEGDEVTLLNNVSVGSGVQVGARTQLGGDVPAPVTATLTPASFANVVGLGTLHSAALSGTPYLFAGTEIQGTNVTTDAAHFNAPGGVNSRAQLQTNSFGIAVSNLPYFSIPVSDDVEGRFEVWVASLDWGGVEPRMAVGYEYGGVVHVPEADQFLSTSEVSASRFRKVGTVLIPGQPVPTGVTRTTFTLRIYWYATRRFTNGFGVIMGYAMLVPLGATARDRATATNARLFDGEATQGVYNTVTGAQIQYTGELPTAHPTNTTFVAMASSANGNYTQVALTAKARPRYIHLRP